MEPVTNIAVVVVHRSGMKSNEDVEVDRSSGDQVIFDQIIDLTDTVGEPALGDGAPFTDGPPAKPTPLIAFE